MADEPIELRIDGISSVRLVRRGDHTALYQAIQTQFGRKVAVKVYTADGARDTAIARFERECVLMGGLSSHPNVVTYFDSGVRRRRPFVVSEWLDEGTFSDMLRRGGTLGWDEAAAVGVKVSGALESAHRAGLVHRKLKPEDVFVSAFGEPLVGDFHFDPGEGSRSGDPYDIMVHAAPELFRGADGDPRVDIYALASVLYTLILGRPPFLEQPDEPLVRIKGRALSSPPPDLRERGVPAPVFAVLAWGLQPSPEHRPATAQEFGRALQASLAATGRADARLLVRPQTDRDRSLPAPTLPAAALSVLIVPQASTPPVLGGPVVIAPPAAAATAVAPVAPLAPTGPGAPPAPGSPTSRLAPAAPPAAATAPAAAVPAPPGVPMAPAAPPKSFAPPVAAPPTLAPAARVRIEPVITPPVLVERVRALIAQARNQYTDPQELHRFDQLERRLDEPLRVAIAGKLKAGKSTLLNGLVGEELAPTNASECTRIVTWYVNGLTYAASLQLNDGTRVETSFTRGDGAIEVDLKQHTPDDVERIVVDWPSSSLTELSLIDTPGIESTSVNLSARTHRFVLPEPDHESQADAIVYLMRHLHPTDVRFLEAFQDIQVGRTNPINAIGVLSRADELAGAQDDALESAAKVAKRYRSSPQVRNLCQTVVPVAGLLAQAAAIMQQGDYNLLARLASLPLEERQVLLATADHFVDNDLVGQVIGKDRRHLIRLLGLYGVRVAIAAISDGEVDSAQALARFLFERSGLGDLRRLLMTQFAARRDVIKAQAALLALGHRLRSSPPSTGVEPLLFALERLRSEAHVFAELELFAAIRSGTVPFGDAEVDGVERLLGAEGYSPTVRLGMSDEATAVDVRLRLVEQIGRWRARSENPLSGREITDAAQVLVRTCEGMLGAMQASA